MLMTDASLEHLLIVLLPSPAQDGLIVYIMGAVDLEAVASVVEAGRLPESGDLLQALQPTLHSSGVVDEHGIREHGIEFPPVSGDHHVPSRVVTFKLVPVSRVVDRVPSEDSQGLTETR